MKKIKYLLLIFVALFSVALVVGCGSNDSTNNNNSDNSGSNSSKVVVTYMVDDSVYQSLTFDSISDINHPTAPTKDGWSFTAWYTDASFTTGTLFIQSTYTGSNTFNLYARFTQDTVNTYVDGVLSGSVVVSELESSKPTKDGLSFDGWYIDAGFTTAYIGQDVDDLYGRFRALVTITNGYEVLHTEFVNEGERFSAPSYESIRKNYMAENGYYNFTAGEIGTEESLYAFDFNNAINSNTVINLVWESEGLEYSLTNTNTLSVKRSYSFGSTNVQYDVLSIPCYSYYEGNLYPVELVNSFYYGTAKKLIVNYNVKGISNTQSSLQSSFSNLEEVVFPDSLEVIFSSFVDTTSFTKDSFTLNDGLEVIIDSFRLGYTSSNGYDFDIVVPNSVSYMSIVTTNYVFGNNSCFYTEDINGEKAIFTTTSYGKTLVSYVPANTIDVVIPEGVYGINASAFTIMNKSLDTLSLPSTFNSVNNYPEHADYSYMNETLFTNVKSYSLLQNLCSYWDTKVVTTVTINQVSLPSELDNCLVGQTSGSVSINYKNSYFDGTYKVLFIGETEGQVFISAYVTNLTTGQNTFVEIELQSGSVITQEYLLSEIMINGTSLADLIDSGDYMLNNIQEFGNDYFLTEEIIVKNNVYLTLNYSVSPAGTELTLSSDSTYYIVTGFDLDTAKLQDNGTYLVNIPATFNNIAVTEIAEEAMAGQTRIGKVVIPSSVTIIGAKAFYNCSNLTELEIQGEYGLCEVVNGVPQYNTIGKIEYIYESAFENTAIISPVIGLESMKYIAPYAFKTPTITHFTNVNTTSSNKGGIKNGANTSSSVVREDLVVGKYYYSFESKVAFIYCYQGQGYETYDLATSGETSKLILDLQIVAVAGGYNTKSGMYHYLTLGSTNGGIMATFAMTFITRVEILEGSMYYLNDMLSNNSNTLVFINVSNVHKNAFTDMSANFSVDNKLSYYTVFGSSRDDCDYMDSNEFSDVAQSYYYSTYVDDASNFNGVFEEGWFEGIMSDDADYEVKMSFMANFITTNSIWYQ